MKNKLPISLLHELQSLKEFSEEAFVACHTNGASITSVRVNPKKQTNVFDNNNKIPWNSSGYYLNKRPDFTADPLLHAGCYYVQEASSMFLAHVLKHTVDLRANLKVLDLCAAPGGKSTLMASLISADSVLVANEVIKTRVSTLVENITKWGSENVFVTNNDPKDFSALENYFDVIVIDAPCSGSGLFRKNEKAIDEWSEENVGLCSQRQQRILADTIPSLKQNGVLIYSTCSYSKQENEDVCDYITEKFHLQSVKIPLDNSWGIVETVSDSKNCLGYRFYPDKLKGEGFFIAAFINKNVFDQKAEHKKQVKQTGLTNSEYLIVEKWITQPRNFVFIKNKNEITAIRNEHEKFYSHIQQTLYVKKAGIRIGEIMNGELIPSHDLALSGILSKSVFRINVDKPTALKYLKKDAFSIPESAKGWLLICYENQPLGWVKNLGNRINNYYPKNWRILKDI